MNTPTNETELNSDNPELDSEEAAAQAAAAKAEAEAEEKAMEAAAEVAAAKGDYSLTKFLNEKRKANREAKNLKEQLKDKKAVEKERDALASRVKKYEDEKKTETERLEARAKEAEEEAAKAKAETNLLKRKGYAADAGVLKEYREFAVSQFAKADEEDPAKFFETFKKTHPAMFNGKKPADPTAKGGAGEHRQPDEITKAISEVEEKIKTAKGMERVALTKRLTQLKEQKGANK
jgi:colicin import membrane protein